MTALTIRAAESAIADIRRGYRAIQTRAQVDYTPPSNPIELAQAIGINLDDWQRAALLSPKKYKILLVSRQGGKTEVGTLLALDKAINDPGSVGLAVGPADRQAKWLLRRIKRRYLQIPGMPPPIQSSATEWELANGSRFLAMPGSEDTIRGLDAVDHVLIDESSRTPDDLFYAVTPMLATTDGSIILMSTPAGKRGFFWDRWENGEEEAWFKVKRTAIDVLATGRITQKFLDNELSQMGQFMFDQEYMVEFKDHIEQLYATHLVDAAVQDIDTLDLPWIGEREDDAEIDDDGDGSFADLSDVWS